MASYNKVFLMGNLTRDPQMKYLPSQTAVAEFGIACNRKYKTAAGEDKEEVAFVDCTAFGRQAETIEQYMTKGKPIFIEGRLRWDSWDDKAGGGKRSKITVVVENFQFIGGRDDGGGHSEPAPAAVAERPARPVNHRGPMEVPKGADLRKGWGGKPQRTEPVAAPFGEEKQFEDLDIPFNWQGRASNPL